jgi:hypothetical protein
LAIRLFLNVGRFYIPVHLALLKLKRLAGTTAGWKLRLGELIFSLRRFLLENNRLFKVTKPVGEGFKTLLSTSEIRNKTTLAKGQR